MNCDYKIKQIIEGGEIKVFVNYYEGDYINKPSRSGFVLEYDRGSLINSEEVLFPSGITREKIINELNSRLKIKSLKTAIPEQNELPIIQ